MEKQRTRLRTAVLPWVLMGLAIIPVFYLHFTALRAADDFYYATFWRNGPAEFWRLVVEHYNTFNGRAFVHLVAQTVLAFPPIVFAVVNTLLLYGTGALSARLDNEAYKGRALPLMVFFFLAQLLLLPTRVLTEGLLWASASYNYMLPVFLTVLALWFLSRFLARTQKCGGFLALFFLVQLTAGATTEQSGFMAAAATGVYGLCWAVRVKKGWWRLFLAPLLNGAGYLTIFLSPATQKRAASAFEWALLRARLGEMADAFFSWDGILLPGLVAGVLLTACLLLPGARRKLGRSIPALLAGAGAGMVIMVPAGNFDPRVMLPVALMFLLVSARCAVTLLELMRAGSPAPALLGAALLSVCVTVCSPLLVGAAENYAVELRNRTAVRQALKTGALFYCIDYGEQWCYPKLMYSEGNYYHDFLAANDVTDCMVYLQSAYMKSVYLNGRRLSSPAYTQDGKVFFSLRDVIEGLGGTVLYVDGGTIYVTLYGQKRTFLPAGVVTWSDENGRQEYSTDGKAAIHYCKACYTAELYKAVFGIDIMLEGDHYICKKAPLI